MKIKLKLKIKIFLKSTGQDNNFQTNHKRLTIDKTDKITNVSRIFIPV
jgi:hypothetical protein